MKQKTFIILVATIATLSIAACEREEEPSGSPSGRGDTVPTVDTIPVVDTIPSDTVPAMPWYHSLVGTQWYSHQDWVVSSLHNVEDIYWEFINDSTIAKTVYEIEMNGVPINDTTKVTIKYSYNLEELKCSIPFPNNNTEDYFLDTVQKTLTHELPPMFTPSQVIFYLIEE